MLSKKSPNKSNSFDQTMQYWQVGDQKTFSKPQAIIWANGNIDKIHYYFMDEVWDSQTWTAPPKQSLSELIRIRCTQLRNKYQHVRVSYSGGYDSQGIIDSFIMAGLPIDSVLIRIKQYKPTQENQIAVQQSQILKNTLWPNLKIDVVNLKADDFYKFYTENANDWITHPVATEPWFAKISLKFLQNYNYEYQQTVDKFVNQIYCDVYGMEKPRLWIEDGNWYATMIDKTISWVADANIENFYITRDLPELHVAQAWAMINWIESKPFEHIDQVNQFLHGVQSHRLGWDTYRDWNLAIGRTAVHNHFSYCGGGTKGYIHSKPELHAASADLLDEAKKFNPEVVKIWKNQLDDFLKQWPNSVTDTGEIINCWSKKHYVKPVEIGRLIHIDTQKH